MNEQYVTSLEMAKKLKAAGWEKEVWYWWDVEFGSLRIGKEVTEYLHDVKLYYPAPLISELLEQLKYEDFYWYYRTHNLEDFVDLFRSPDKLAQIWLDRNKTISND